MKKLTETIAFLRGAIVLISLQVALNGGVRGARTHNPLHVKQVLSH